MALQRFWISWTQPGNDTRPTTWPLPPTIPAYWMSGENDVGATLCALVDAPTEAEAIAAIEAAWSQPIGTLIRFVEPKHSLWRPGADRFPWPAWRP